MERVYDIHALTSDGRGLSRVPGEKVVFVSQALPGDRVAAEIVNERKGYVEARTTRLLEPSPHSVTPPCPHADECGGCPLMRLSYKEQLVWKERFVADAVTRTGGLADPPIRPVLPSPETTACRNRLELVIGLDDSGKACLGMRRRSSHSVVPTPFCALMPAAGHAVVARLNALLAESGLSVYAAPEEDKGARGRQRSGRPARSAGFLRFCQLRFGRVPDDLSLARADHVPDREGIWVILLTSPGSVSEKAAMKALATELLLACPQVHAVIHEERSSLDLLTRGEKRLFAMGRLYSDLDPALMVMPLAGIGYLVDAADFFQVNTAGAELLVRTAREAGAPESLVDLYCGVGAPGLSLTGGSVLGVEYSRTATATALRNARRFGADGRYEAGDADKVLARPVFREAEAPVILCDPPRAGMTPPVISYILRKKAERVLYISCNPQTLARDMKALAEAYAPVFIQPVDLFPHTPHIESAALLERR